MWKTFDINLKTKFLKFKVISLDIFCKDTSLFCALETSRNFHTDQRAFPCKRQLFKLLSTKLKILDVFLENFPPTLSLSPSKNLNDANVEFFFFAFLSFSVISRTTSKRFPKAGIKWSNGGQFRSARHHRRPAVGEGKYRAIWWRPKFSHAAGLRHRSHLR